MPTESDNYANGRSGFGAPNYTSSGWRAGDIERTRLEREKAQQQQQQLDREFFLAKNRNIKANSYVQTNIRANSYVKTNIRANPSMQKQSDGEGCFTVLFSIGSYIIVFSALYNLIINATNILSKNYALSIPDYPPAVNVIFISGIVFLCRKFIGWMALLSIVIFIGIHYLYEDVNKIYTPHEKSVSSTNTLTKKQRAINAIQEAQKSTMTFIPPMRKDEILAKELLRKQGIITASAPKTNNLRKALTETLNITSTTNEYYKMTGTRSALSLPRQEKEFCADTKKLLKKIYVGNINKIDCSYKDVTVTAERSVINYNANINQAVIVK